MHRTTELLRSLGWRVVEISPEHVTLRVPYHEAHRQACILRRQLEARGCLLWAATNTRGQPHASIVLDPVSGAAHIHLAINDAALFGDG